MTSIDAIPDDVLEQIFYHALPLTGTNSDPALGLELAFAPLDAHKAASQHIQAIALVSKRCQLLIQRPSWTYKTVNSLEDVRGLRRQLAGPPNRVTYPGATTSLLARTPCTEEGTSEVVEILTYFPNLTSLTFYPDETHSRRTIDIPSSFIAALAKCTLLLHTITFVGSRLRIDHNDVHLLARAELPLEHLVLPTIHRREGGPLGSLAQTPVFKHLVTLVIGDSSTLDPAPIDCDIIQPLFTDQKTFPSLRHLSLLFEAELYSGIKGIRVHIPSLATFETHACNNEVVHLDLDVRLQHLLLHVIDSSDVVLPSAERLESITIVHSSDCQTNKPDDEGLNRILREILTGMNTHLSHIQVYSTLQSFAPNSIDTWTALCYGKRATFNLTILRPV